MCDEMNELIRRAREAAADRGDYGRGFIDGLQCAAGFAEVFRFEPRGVGRRIARMLRELVVALRGGR